VATKHKCGTLQLHLGIQFFFLTLLLLSVLFYFLFKLDQTTFVVVLCLWVQLERLGQLEQQGRLGQLERLEPEARRRLPELLYHRLVLYRKGTCLAVVPQLYLFSCCILDRKLGEVPLRQV
jgi:hypothetical protein